jgi:hypothetical protein
MTEKHWFLKRNKIPVDNLVTHCFRNFTDFSSDDFHVPLFKMVVVSLIPNLLPLMTTDGYLDSLKPSYYFGFSIAFGFQ